MGYLGKHEIDDLLTFPANTHTAATGAATDADSVPTYRVYEDETTTPILTGSMALLDGSNTVGFYSEQITLSAANGFEVGKSYTIYITATVAGVVGTISHTFKVEVLLATASALATAQTAIDDIATNAELATALAASDDAVLAAVAVVDSNVDTLVSSITTVGDVAEAVRIEIDSNSTKLDVVVSTRSSQVSVDDLPTNAELATSQASADDATLAAIAALNNLSAAQVNAEVDTALADYDAPTFTELDARTDAIDAALVAIAVFVDTEVAAILAAVDTEISAIKVVTDALTALAAAKLALSAGTIVSGAAAAGTLSTTAMTTNLTEATDDHYNGRIIIWTSGVLQNQATDITDYNGTTKTLTFTAVTEAPTAADTFVIV